MTRIEHLQQTIREAEAGIREEQSKQDLQASQQYQASQRAMSLENIASQKSMVSRLEAQIDDSYGLLRRTVYRRMTEYPAHSNVAPEVRALIEPRTQELVSLLIGHKRAQDQLARLEGLYRANYGALPTGQDSAASTPSAAA